MKKKRHKLKAKPNPTNRIQKADASAQERITACNKVISEALKKFNCAYIDQIQVEKVGDMGNKVQVVSTHQLAALRPQGIPDADV
jgi:hypothetical protein